MAGDARETAEMKEQRRRERQTGTWGGGTDRVAPGVNTPVNAERISLEGDQDDPDVTSDQRRRSSSGCPLCWLFLACPHGPGVLGGLGMPS